MTNREIWVSDAMIELSDTLASDYNLTELLNVLAERCSELLDAAEVGIVIADEHEALHATSASTRRMRVLELLELQRSEGPRLDCIRGGSPVQATLTDDTALARWPDFHQVAVQAGYRQVLVLPMRLREVTIGAVNVFLDGDGKVPVADVRLAQALADIATIGILQQRTTREWAVRADQLQDALNSRIVIEQAKGMLATHHRISVDEAFTLLRNYSRNHNVRLTNVARAIANQQLSLNHFATAKNRSGQSTS